MKILAIILITFMIITMIIVSALYFRDKEAEGILDISIITTGLTFIYKLAKGGK